MAPLIIYDLQRINAMGMTHSFTIKVNGTDLAGEIDLSDGGGCAFELQGDIKMDINKMKNLSVMLVELGKCFNKFTTVEELEINILP